jgi:hypothetical protein
MLYSSLIVAASALAGFASAQTSNSSAPDTIIPCCSVPANQVPQNQREGWCSAQRNTCVELCGGRGEIANNGNDCQATDLDYTCKCANGTDISDSMSSYQQTVPGQMCLFWFDACINATGSDAEAQFNCIQARDTKCGNDTIDASGSGSDSSSSASASTSSGPSATGSGAGSASSPTGSDAAEPSKAAAASFSTYGTPALAGGLLALFGLAL